MKAYFRGFFFLIEIDCFFLCCLSKTVPEILIIKYSSNFNREYSKNKEICFCGTEEAYMPIFQKLTITEPEIRRNKKRKIYIFRYFDNNLDNFVLFSQNQIDIFHFILGNMEMAVITFQVIFLKFPN